jgi:hypothetical protein
MTNTRPYYGTNHEFKFWFCHVQARAQVRWTTFLSHVFAISFAQLSLQCRQRKASEHDRTAKLTRRASPMSVHLSLEPYGTVGWSCSTSHPRTGGKAGGQYGAECFNRRCGWTVVPLCTPLCPVRQEADPAGYWSTPSLGRGCTLAVAGGS